MATIFEQIAAEEAAKTKAGGRSVFEQIAIEEARAAGGGRGEDLLSETATNKGTLPAPISPGPAAGPAGPSSEPAGPGAPPESEEDRARREARTRWAQPFMGAVGLIPGAARR